MRKCWKPAFSPLLTMFSTLLEREIIISAIFTLSSANAFSLNQSKILPFCKGLKRDRDMKFSFPKCVFCGLEGILGP